MHGQATGLVSTLYSPACSAAACPSSVCPVSCCSHMVSHAPMLPPSLPFPATHHLLSSSLVIQGNSFVSLLNICFCVYLLFGRSGCLAGRPAACISITWYQGKKFFFTVTTVMHMHTVCWPFRPVLAESNHVSHLPLVTL